MKLLKCSVKNFGSYQDLTFDFNNLGLSLVYGPTGSGKSTLPDIPAWILFGTTSKGYKADEVKNWSNLDDITKGTLQVETSNGNIVVTRIRSRSNQNDLYWKEEGKDDDSIRGKDLVDTQRLLNARLGIDPDLYISGSYYHEFCSTGSFFLASTSAKRELFEKVVDLSLPLNLLDKAKEYDKVAKQEYDALLLNERDLKLNIEYTAKDIGNTKQQNLRWVDDKNDKLNYSTKQHDNYEKHRIEEIKNIDDKINSIKIYNINEVKEHLIKLKEEVKSLKAEKCPSCGGSKHSEEIYKKLDIISMVEDEISEQESLRNEIKYLKSQQERVISQINPYIKVIEELKSSINTYQDRLNELEGHLLTLNDQLRIVQDAVKSKYDYMTALWKISSLSFELRGLLLNRVVNQIQDSVNLYLEDYFDSEIKVYFKLEDADKLTVELYKNGHQCVYKQLSKGQRALLRLAFVVSVMKSVSSNHGIHFDNLFMDEALDGLDNELKSKAFRLFEVLSTEHSSIIIIDHSEDFKTLFNKQFSVTMDSDISTIKEINE